jgi:hypothetical protein
MTLKQDLSVLARLDRLVARANQALDHVKGMRDEWEWHVLQRMEDEGFDQGDDVKHRGTRYGRQVTYYAKVQDPFEFNTWAEQHAPHLIKPRPAKQQLNELVNAAKEDGTPLPPGVAANPKFWVSRRAA